MRKQIYPPEEYDRWWDYGKPAKKRRKRVRKLTLRQALAQASKAGVAVSGATIAADGSVTLLQFGSDTSAKSKGNGHDIETAEELRGLI